MQSVIIAKHGTLPSMSPTPQTSVGIFTYKVDSRDVFWKQCNGAAGRHGSLQVLGADSNADHILCIGIPIPDAGRPGRRGLSRWIRGRGSNRERFAWCFERLKRSRNDVTVLFYEPPGIVTDVEYEVARAYASRVYGPDERATHPITLPVMWRAPLHRDELLALKPNENASGLAIVTSGKSKLAGHRERLDFLRRLRRENIPFDLYGMDLPDDLGSLGPVESKHEVSLGARFTLAIENDVIAKGYVTEKLWDPLLAWSLPLYFGSSTADEVISNEAYVRIPELGERGVATIREALDHPEWRDQRIEPMTRAREQIVGPLRLVQWIQDHVLQGSRP